jgi:hypothetical protein
MSLEESMRKAQISYDMRADDEFDRREEIEHDEDDKKDKAEEWKYINRYETRY